MLQDTHLFLRLSPLKLYQIPLYHLLANHVKNNQLSVQRLEEGGASRTSRQPILYYRQRVTNIRYIFPVTNTEHAAPHFSPERGTEQGLPTSENIPC